MTPLPTDATGPSESVTFRQVHRSLLGSLLALACVFVAGLLAVDLGHRFASEAVIDLGPTDARYARGFRDIERDGPVWFRWSVVPSSTVALPLRFCGPGTLSLRVRRHFVDPALLSISVGGTVLGQRSVQASSEHAYEVLKFQVPKITCDQYSAVLLETTIENDRPLGVAVDWVEVEALDGFRAGYPALVRGALFLVLVWGALRLVGASLPLAIAVAAAQAALIGVGFAAAPVASERILRGGLAALIVTLALGAALARFSGLLGLDARGKTLLITVTLFTLLTRSAFLHTQAFYPDYRVHGLVQQTYSRGGLSRFLDNLFEIQYARSLGLQQIGGNWYPFPYPPGSYAVTDAVAGLSRLDPLDASIATASGLAALMPALTAALGLALGLGAPISLAGACFVVLQPLMVRRMALGYFPGIAGQFADAAAMLLLLAVLRSRSSDLLRRSALLGMCLLLGFLVYTQSIANFGLLIAGLLVVAAARRTPLGIKPTLFIAAAGTLALGASIWAFYGRYQPVVENIRAHRAQPESRVLDRLEQARRAAPSAAEGTAESDDLNDPYAGSTFDPSRGILRLGSRLWRFNGPFALLLPVGLWLLWRQSESGVQNLGLAWCSVALWISVLAAGLPSPNGFQHLKDLEFVTPLAALAMGAATLRLWQWRPVAATVMGLAWAGFAVKAFAAEWTERLLPLLDR